MHNFTCTCELCIQTSSSINFKHTAGGLNAIIKPINCSVKSGKGQRNMHARTQTLAEKYFVNNTTVIFTMSLALVSV